VGKVLRIRKVAHVSKNKKPQHFCQGFCGVARAGVFFPDRYGHNGTMAGFVLFGGGV